MIKVPVHHNSGEKVIREYICDKFRKDEAYELDVVERYFKQLDEKIESLKADAADVQELLDDSEKEVARLNGELSDLKSLL